MPEAVHTDAAHCSIAAPTAMSVKRPAPPTPTLGHHRRRLILFLRIRAAGRTLQHEPFDSVASSGWDGRWG
jgi:hypothetical protein